MTPDAGDADPVGPTRRGRPLRRDAAANQERLLAAAVTSVLRHGQNVSLARSAEKAGVGIGTLYRRYPSREHLLEALQVRALHLVIDWSRRSKASTFRGWTPCV